MVKCEVAPLPRICRRKFRPAEVEFILSSDEINLLFSSTKWNLYVPINTQLTPVDAYLEGYHSEKSSRVLRGTLLGLVYLSESLRSLELPHRSC